MLRIRNTGIAAAFIALIALGTSIHFSGKRAAKQRLPLTDLQPQSLEQFKREFNAASDRVRVILLLSPT